MQLILATHNAGLHLCRHEGYPKPTTIFSDPEFSLLWWYNSLGRGYQQLTFKDIIRVETAIDPKTGLHRSSFREHHQPQVCCLTRLSTLRSDCLGHSRGSLPQMLRNHCSAESKDVDFREGPIVRLTIRRSDSPRRRNPFSRRLRTTVVAQRFAYSSLATMLTSFTWSWMGWICSWSSPQQ